MGALLAWVLSSPTVLAVGAGIIAVAGAWFNGRLSGAKAERHKQQVEELAARGEAQKIDDAVAGRAPNDNRERLGKWSKS